MSKPRLVTIYRIALTATLYGLFCSDVDIDGKLSLPTTAYAFLWGESSCNTKDNMSETARSFIARCCNGSINREFPDQWYDERLDAIKSAGDTGDASAKKAWKLLSDNRFRK